MQQGKPALNNMVTTFHTLFPKYGTTIVKQNVRTW